MPPPAHNNKPTAWLDGWGEGRLCSVSSVENAYMCRVPHVIARRFVHVLVRRLGQTLLNLGANKYAAIKFKLPPKPGTDVRPAVHT